MVCSKESTCTESFADSPVQVPIKIFLDQPTDIFIRSMKNSILKEPTFTNPIGLSFGQEQYWSEQEYLTGPDLKCSFHVGSVGRFTSSLLTFSSDTFWFICFLLCVRNLFEFSIQMRRCFFLWFLGWFLCVFSGWWNWPEPQVIAELQVSSKKKQFYTCISGWSLLELLYPHGIEGNSQYRHQGPFLHNNPVFKSNLKLPALTVVQLHCYSFWYMNVINFIATWVLCQLPFSLNDLSLNFPHFTTKPSSTFIKLACPKPSAKISLVQWGYSYMSIYFKPFVIFCCSVL